MATLSCFSSPSLQRPPPPQPPRPPPPPATPRLQLPSAGIGHRAKHPRRDSFLQPGQDVAAQHSRAQLRPRGTQSVPFSTPDRLRAASHASACGCLHALMLDGRAQRGESRSGMNSWPGLFRRGPPRRSPIPRVLDQHHASIRRIHGSTPKPQRIESETAELGSPSPRNILDPPRASSRPVQVSAVTTTKPPKQGQQKQQQQQDPEPPSTLVILWRKLVRQLSSLPLAIGLLFMTAVFCALGTLIDQGASPGYYLQAFTADHPALGFLPGRLILFLGLDHVYSAPLFLGTLALLAGSLTACTSTRQLPMLRVARRWSFLQSPTAIRRLEAWDSLDNARLVDLGVQLRARGYEVFRYASNLYAFKGLVGRMAPIGVHAALLLVMAGGCYSALGGFQGTTMTPQGLDVFVPSALEGNSWLARPTSSMNMLVHVDRFYIDYRPSGEVKQFYSDLTVTDLTGRELLHKTISVNDPLRCQGVTIYQTDWAISAIQLRANGGDPLKLPMAALEDRDSSTKLFGTFLPVAEAPSPAAAGAGAVDGGAAVADAVPVDAVTAAAAGGRPRGITILARDLQSVVLYDGEGKFVGVRRPGSNKPIAIDGVSVVIDELIGSTGLELKMDPGVPYVYAGFGALMLTSFISYLSHSQVWALQDGATVWVGGKSNRAKLSFKQELNEILDLVPEVLPSSSSALVASTTSEAKSNGGERSGVQQQEELQ